MKKTLILLTGALLALCLLAGCGGNSSGVPTLPDMVEQLCEGADVPTYETIELNESNFKSYAFVPYEEGITACAADAVVNINAHSLVLIHTENGNTGELANSILTSADPRKWVCVNADKVTVAYTDHYIMLLMSYDTTTEDILANFNALVPTLNDGTATVLTGAAGA